jgi:hypothetical protein
MASSPRNERRSLPRDPAAHRVDWALRMWQGTVARLEQGYRKARLDDFNDALEARSVLREALPSLPFRVRRAILSRLLQLDRRFRAATDPATRCVDMWGCHHDKGAEWWWYRVPRSHPEWPVCP